MFANAVQQLSLSDRALAVTERRGVAASDAGSALRLLGVVHAASKMINELVPLVTSRASARAAAIVGPRRVPEGSLPPEFKPKASTRTLKRRAQRSRLRAEDAPTPAAQQPEQAGAAFAKQRRGPQHSLPVRKSLRLE